MLLSIFLSFLLFRTGSINRVWAQSSIADTYLAVELPIAKTNLFANIGPSGSRSQGAKPGIVIASPSTINPNYLFSWVRDSALVFQAVVSLQTRGTDNTLTSAIDSYVASQNIIQQIPNPSGTVSSGGLGEPKFNIDETAFTDNWGRPQRGASSNEYQLSFMSDHLSLFTFADGPALRATTLINWANILISQKNTSYVTSTLWPMIKLDLDYVASSWNQSTFDLWEEVSSSSFFTTAVQHRSLRQGVALATAIGQTSVVSQYTTQAANLLCFLQSYWNTAGYMTANTGGNRSGKDSNTVLASIHTFDADAGCDAVTFQPCSDRALSSLKVYVDSFRFYAINNGIPENQGIATGRYPEDTYFGGNPWYLATMAVAEQLYDALTVWTAQGSLTVTATSQSFFQVFSSGVATGTYASSTTTFTTLTSAIKNYADSFVAVVAKYTPPDGGLAEQFNRNDGSPLSAAHLTWSYASVMTASDARAGGRQTWGAKGLTVPGTCASNPGNGGGAGTVDVTFNVQATTVFGENIYLTGSVDALVNWSPDRALPLSAANYPVWSVTVKLPAGLSVEYKYIRKFNGAVTWESDPNMQVNVPASGSTTLNDSWR